MSVSMCISRSQFLYIIVLCQLQLVELSRFQYYFNCDCMFDLFDCIEVYSCEAQLYYLTESPSFCLLSVELYSLCCEVKNSFVNLLYNVSRDLLQSLKSSFNMTVFAHQHNNYSWEQQQQCCQQCR